MMFKKYNNINNNCINWARDIINKSNAIILFLFLLYYIKCLSLKLGTKYNIIVLFKVVLYIIFISILFVFNLFLLLYFI